MTFQIDTFVQDVEFGLRWENGVRVAATGVEMFSDRNMQILELMQARADEAGLAQRSTSRSDHISYHLTRALAMDHSAEGIRVNAVCPGWAETSLNKNFLAIGPHIRDQVGKMHAIGRIGQPEEVATAVACLASDEASFITGALLAVDGGITAGLAPTLGVVL